MPSHRQDTASTASSILQQVLELGGNPRADIGLVIRGAGFLNEEHIDKTTERVSQMIMQMPQAE